MPVLRGVVWTGNLLILVFVVGLGIWSALAPLHSAAVASGVIEPETSRKTIQHLEGGIVRRILVRNGDTVMAGQIVIELDDTKSRSERDSIQGQLWDAEGSRARLLAEQTGGDHEVILDDPPEGGERQDMGGDVDAFLRPDGKDQLGIDQRDIQPVRAAGMNRGFRAAGDGVMDAFYAGYALVEKEKWDYVVKLDGDLSFRPDYFERCFERFDVDLALGIAGGTICSVEGKGMRTPGTQTSRITSSRWASWAVCP